MVTVRRLTQRPPVAPGIIEDTGPTAAVRAVAHPARERSGGKGRSATMAVSA